MFKVIVERPRIKNRWDTNRNPIPYIKGDAEDLPKLESMKNKKVRGYGKRLNENLSPLYRFLRGSVGRCWDDIWSELCEHLDDKSAVKKHVKDHAKDFAQTEILMVGDQPYELAKYSRGGWRPLYCTNRYPEYYIHPETHILTKAPVKFKPRKINYITKIQICPGRHFEWHGDMWWEVETTIYWDTVPEYGYVKVLQSDGITFKDEYRKIGLKPVQKFKYDWKLVGKKKLKLIDRYFETGSLKDPKKNKKRFRGF